MKALGKIEKEYGGHNRLAPIEEVERDGEVNQGEKKLILGQPGKICNCGPKGKAHLRTDACPQ